MKTRLLTLLLVFSLTLTACAAPAGTPAAFSPTAESPDFTSTNTPLPLPDPTVTLPPGTTPTLTPTAEPPSPGMLSAAQRQALATAAQAYISPTPEEAIATAIRLDYIGRNANPATMCGPLALAILKDAGIIEPGIPLVSFYYLNPRPMHDERRLQEVFPPERFEKITREEPVDQIDYSVDPLFPGDFLYLFAGESGSFEHMLVVSRVDEAGRAYAVTNINTDEGVVINEVMLYDPAQPGVGQFYEWTDWQNRMIGRTGNGGLWLWRLSEPIIEKTESFRQLETGINNIINTGGKWNILIKEVNGDVLYSHLAYERINPASIIKLADAVLFLKVIEEKEVGDIVQYLTTYGIESRSFDQLLRAMVVNSEEGATESIERYTAELINPQSMLRDMGFTNTTITPRQSNAVEMSRMLEMLYSGSLLAPDTTAYLLNLLAEYTPSDQVRTGVLRDLLGANDKLYNKRGSLAKDLTIVADLALLEHGDKAYVLAFFSYAGEDPSVKYEELEAGIEAISLTFWQFISED